MASSQNFTTTSQPRLPALVIVGDAVDAASGTKESKSKANSWACSIRQRINAQLKDTGKVNQQDLELLVAELINVFVTVLQKNNRSSWLFLHEVFQLLHTYQSHLYGKKELLPYLEKIYSQYQNNQALVSDLDILGAMDKAFPKDLSFLYGNVHSSFQQSLRTHPPQLKSLMESIQLNPSPAFSGQPYPFVLERPTEKPEDVFKPAPMMLKDLQKGVAVVGPELVQLEALWKSSLGFTLLALGTDLPVDFLSMDSKLPQVSEGDGAPDDKKRDLQLSPSSKDGISERSEYEPMTGRSAIELCMKYRYQQKITFLYLNIARNRHYRPYDLVVVPKVLLDAEHYIFSPFGILHVHPEQGADAMRLEEWHREAVLWELLQDIPFFKQFQIRRVFFSWLKKVKKLKILRKVEVLGNHLLAAVPHFGTILQHISRLLQELSSVHWFPHIHSHCFTFLELQQALTSQNEQARITLKKFLSFCTAILKLLRDDSYKIVEILQKQVQNPRPLVVNEPLHLQRILQVEMEKKLRKAQFCMQRLGNLAHLVNHMVCQSLVSIMQEEVTTFVYKVIQTVSPEREAFLKVSLVFDSDRQLVLVPSGQLVQDCLCSALDSALRSVVQLVPSTNGKESKETIEEREEREDSDSSDMQKSSSTVDETEECLDLLKMPKVDSSVTAVTKHITIPVVVATALSDVQDRKLEFQLRLHETAARCSSLMQRNSLQEVQEFCTEHDWLAEIYGFVYSWRPQHLKVMRDCTADQYKEQILQLQSWTERVNEVKSSFITQNNILFVDCSNIQKEIVPLLVSTTEEIFSLLTAESVQKAQLLVSEFSDAIRLLQTISTDIPTFSHCTRKVEKYKQHIPELQNRINYVQSLNEVIRNNCRPLNTEEETLENKMLDSWETFLSHMTYVSEFISREKPVISMQLMDSIDALLQEQQGTVTTATTGKFLDPSQNVQDIMDKLRKLQNKHQSITEKIKYLNQTRILLTGESLDLAVLSKGEELLNLRFKVWQLLEIISKEVEEWKQQPLTQFNSAAVQEKLNSWKKILGLLEKSLPVQDDVLQACLQLVADFAQYLPLLEMLGSPALKEKHWWTIYTAMGKVYHRDQVQTVSDLIGYPLLKHQDVITRICNKAEASLTSLKIFRKLQQTWQQREFRLAKFFLYVWHQDPPPDHSRRLPSGQIREPEGAYFSQDSGTFILTGTENLKILVEDSILTLQILQSSPHAAAGQELEMESWAELLQSFGFLLDFWVTFQQKWIFLTKVLHEMKISLPHPELVSKFEAVDFTYRAFIQAVCHNPSVLAILPNQKIGKMKNEFQGARLKTMLSSGITVMEEIIQDLQYLLENIRASCPRLYFLSNEEVLAVIATSDDPNERISWVKRCFQNIQDVESETLEKTDGNPLLELPVYRSKAVTKAFMGCCGEKVFLQSPLKSDLRTPAWLSNFETAMKNTLFLLLQDCVAERLSLQKKIESAFENRPGPAYLSSQPPKVNLGTELWAQLAVAFPFQCILVAEQVSWNIEVQESLFRKKVSKAELRQKHNLKFETMVQSIQKHNHQRSSSLPGCSLLLPLFSALVTLMVHHRDIIQKLLKQKVDSKISFEWAKLLKFNVSVSSEKAKEYTKRFTPNALLDVWLQNGNDEAGCYVEILDNTLLYDYEYIGPSRIPVISTMTEKSMLGLIFAIEQYHCGTVIGPDGVGKMETLSGLANALGRLIVSLNCSEQLGISCISQQLCGAMQLGAWLVIDHAERMSQGKLSVLGQLLMDIHKSYMAVLEARGSFQKCVSVPASGEQDFPTNYELPKNPMERTPNLTQPYKPRVFGNIHFNGNSIPIGQNYGCFIILSRLDSSIPIPANLRILMRPVSLFQPDLQKISEVSLLAAGFQEATHLSGKLCYFLRLSQELGYKPNPNSLCFLRNVIIATLNIYQSSRKLKAEIHTLLPDIPEEAMNKASFVRDETTLFVKEKRITWSSTAGHHRLHTSSSPAYQCIAKGMEEETAMIRALCSSPLFADGESSELYHHKELLRNIFPLSVTIFPEVGLYTRLNASVTHTKTYFLSSLTSSVSLELQESKLHVDSDLTATILQLFQTLLHTRCVMIVGPPGSGKTTSWKTLARAINRLAPSKELGSLFMNQTKEHGSEVVSSSGEHYGPVSSVCLYPNSLCAEEFLGEMENGNWRDGLFLKILRRVILAAHAEPDSIEAKFDVVDDHRSHPASTQKWLVLDGTTSSEWLDPISCLFNTHPFLSLPNGEQMEPPNSLKFIFEDSDVSRISPSLSTRCGLVYCSGNRMWQAEFGSLMTMITKKYNVAQGTADMLKKFSKDNFPATFTFLKQSCKSVLETHNDLSSEVCGMQEISSFKKIFQTLMQQQLSYDNIQRISLTGKASLGKVWSVPGSPYSDQKEHLERQTQNIFLFAYIWGFGSHLNPRYWPQFDFFVRRILIKSELYVQLPQSGTIFDYFPNPEDASLTTFKGNYSKRKNLAGFVILPQHESLIYIMDCLLESGAPVLLVGEAGAGKSSFAQMMIYPNRTFKRIAISATLSTTHFRQLLQSKVSESKGFSTENLVNHSEFLFLLDDIHAAVYNERSQSYPIHEVIRQVLSGHGIHNADSLLLGHEAHSTLINSFATTTVPSGTYPLSARFTRLFTVFALPTATREYFVSIYAPKIKAWLKKISILSRGNELSTAVIEATVDLYYAVRKMFQPSPSCWQYVFSLHDIEKVLRGLFLLPLQLAFNFSFPMRDSRFKGELSADSMMKRIILRLWLHESLRTFSDRLIKEEEKAQFVDLMVEVAQLAFCTEKSVPYVNPEDSSSAKKLFSGDSKKQKISQASRRSSSARRSITEQSNNEFKGRVDSRREPSLPQNPDLDLITEPLVPETDNVTIESTVDMESIRTTQSRKITLVETVPRLSSTPTSSEEEEEKVAETQIAEDSATETLHTIDSKIRAVATSSPSIPAVHPLSKPSQSALTLKGKAKQTEVDKGIRKLEMTANFQPSSLAPYLQSKTQVSRPSSRRHRISWKSEITEKPGHVVPLLPQELLLPPEELLQDLIFSKDMLPTSDTPSTPTLYLEREPETLRRQLSAFLQDESLEEIQHSGLVLHQEAIHHLARLTRALSMRMGHSVLIAMQPNTGRRSLVTLAAQLTRSLLLEITDQSLESEVNELIKKASRHAGILHQRAVLLVHQRVSVSTIEKLLSLMGEGTIPGLYSPNEKEAIVQDFLEANKIMRKNTKPEVVLESFLEQLKKKLHVFMLLDYGNGCNALRFPVPTIRSLLRLAFNIDVYCSWSHKTLLDVASYCLLDFSSTELMQNQGTLLAGEHQHQLWNIIQVMPQIHQSTSRYAELLCPCLPLITPKNYLDFIDVFLTFKTKLRKTSEETLNRLMKALNKAKIIGDEAEMYRKKAESQLQELVDTRKYKEPFQSQVEASQADLSNLLEQSSSHQSIVSSLEGQMEVFHVNTQQYLDQISLEFLEEAGTLQVYDIEELRSYRVPPPLVVLVTDTLCMMFGRNSGWENAKQLIGQDNFYQDLVFFNKNQITDEMYNALSETTARSDFNPVLIQTASSAAASLCRWIHAVQRYCGKFQRMSWSLQQQQDYEAQVQAAQNQLGETRLQVEEQKLVLKGWLRHLEDNQEKEKKLEEEHSQTIGKQEEAEVLEETMALYVAAWTAALEVMKHQSLTLSGDSLLLAAAVSYLGAFPVERAEELLEKWKRICDGRAGSLDPNDVEKELEKTGILPVSSRDPTGPAPILYREDFNLLELLSTQKEQSSWHDSNLPCNSSVRDTAVLLRAFTNHCRRRWPLLVDPDQQGELWLRVLQKHEDLEKGKDCLENQSTSNPKHYNDQGKPHDELLVITANDPDLDNKLQAAASEGKRVLLTKIERRPSSPILTMLLQREKYFQNQKATFPFFISPSFRLFLSTSLSLDTIADVLNPSFFKNLHVTDMSINHLTLEELLLKKILDSEMPRLHKQWWKLDQTHLDLQEELRKTENLLMERVIQTSPNASQAQEFLPLLQYYEDRMASLHENLQGLVSLHLQQEELLEEFRKLSRLGAAIYIALQHISRLHPVYCFSAETILKVTQGILESKKRKDASQREVLKARIIDLVNSLIRKTLAYVQRFLPASHAKLFSFLVAIAQLSLAGQVTGIEWIIFLQGMKDSEVTWALPPTSILKPSWVSMDAWKECSLLEILPEFANLRSTLVNQSCQWQEYFKLSSTVIGPVPCASYAHLTLFQKAILWRIFRPDKFYQITCDLTTCVLGGSLAEDCWFEMSSIFSLSKANIPVVYRLPAAGSLGSSTHPLYYIEKIAKEFKKEGSMRVISFGTLEVKAKVLDSLITCQREGHWLVLNNCNLLDHWTNDVIKQLIELTDSPTEYPSDSVSEKAPSPVKNEDIEQAAVDSKPSVHPEFRLWFITTMDAAKSVPGHIIPQALNLFWETPQELKVILGRSCSQAMARPISHTPMQWILALAVLHSVLLHRQQYGSIAQTKLYQWSEADLFTALSVQEKMWSFCKDPEGTMTFLAGSIIYGGHIVDPTDAATVFSVSQGCLNLHSSLLPSQGLENFLSTLIGQSLSGFQDQHLVMQEIKERIQKLPIPADPVSFGLCSGVEEPLVYHQSQVMFADLLTTQEIWQPSQTPASQTEKLKCLLNECVKLLKDMQEQVQRKEEELRVKSKSSTKEEGRKTPPRFDKESSRPSFRIFDREEEWMGSSRSSSSRASSQDSNKDTSLDPLRSFLLQEWKGFSQMISKLHTDLCCIQDELQEGPCLCRKCDDITWALLKGCLPKIWNTYISAGPPLSVPQWLNHLSSRLQLLSGYLELESREDAHYNPSVFQNPKGLLLAVLEERAKAEHQDLDQYCIHAQILQGSLLSGTVPQYGVYLTGLQLYNALWDTRLAVIQETLSIKPCSLPVVWIKAEPVTEQKSQASSVYPQYLCPLYVCTEREGLVLPTAQSLLSLLLTSKLDPLVCSQRRVHARSVL
ncbi:dynein heavy chain domain-containing protein 1 [Rhinatrema bivittatum]|uniref:dynein heavy chain domain-containing protein 1 n=1 Tax=Rhinatrema bivittatum TaxID=194408 RepID=UPI00112D2A53|nr:dynein heavy chain domain-containing protein 1 [Rhinatrema bivittatum]